MECYHQTTLLRCQEAVWKQLCNGWENQNGFMVLRNQWLTSRCNRTGLMHLWTYRNCGRTHRFKPDNVPVLTGGGGHELPFLNQNACLVFLSINLVSLQSQCVWNINQQQNRGKQTIKSRKTVSGDGRVILKHSKNPFPNMPQPLFLLSRRDCLP